MALATYTDLQASLKAWLYNRSTISAMAADFIALAEAQMDAQVRHRKMTVSTSLTLAGELTSLPADFRGPVSLTIGTRVLPQVTLEQMADDKLSVTGADSARYAILGDQLQVWPAPAAATSATLVYMQAIPALSVANPTNWLLSRFPNAYLYGALMQASPYLANDERVPVWAAGYQAALDSIRQSDVQERLRGPSMRAAAPIV